MDSHSQKFTLFNNRDLLNLIIPLVIERVLFITVGAADGMMVASLGEASVSGVAVIDMINNFIGNIYFGLSTGGAVVASQYLGACDMPRARDSARQLLFVTGAFALFVLLLAELFNREILRILFGTLAPHVMEQASTYFRITAFTYPMVSIYSACSALFRSMNKSNYSMYSSMLCNILNICGNALFIFVFKMGVAGAAFSTLIARIVSMLMLLSLLMNRSNPIYLTLKGGLSLSLELIRRILFIGIPSSIENGIFQFGRLLVVGIIAKFGTIEIAANSVANNIDSFGVFVAASFSLAMITVVGQCVGAGSEAQTRFYIRKMMRWTYTAHICWNLLFFALTPLLLKCYVKLEPQTLQLAFILILIHNGIGLILWPTAFVFPNALRAANDVKFTMVASISSMFIIRLGLSYAIAYFFHIGALGVWIAMIVDWIVRIVCFTWRYHSNAWLRHADFKRP